MSEPRFLSIGQIDAIHARGLAAHGGLEGTRDQGGLEAAAMHPRNVFCYENGDIFEITAAYAFHLAESQAYVDVNKRTAVASALVFLRANGIQVEQADPMALYESMISVAKHQLDRKGLAAKFQSLFHEPLR